MTEEQLIAMKLHESASITSYITVLRVVNGWIYRFWNDKTDDWHAGGVFVNTPS